MKHNTVNTSQFGLRFPNYELYIYLSAKLTKKSKNKSISAKIMPRVPATVAPAVIPRGGPPRGFVRYIADRLTMCLFIAKTIIMTDFLYLY